VANPLCTPAIAAGAGMSFQVIADPYALSGEPMHASLIYSPSARLLSRLLFARRYHGPRFRVRALVGGSAVCSACSSSAFDRNAARIGVVLMLGLVVAGQVAASTIIDHSAAGAVVTGLLRRMPESFWSLSASASWRLIASDSTAGDLHAFSILGCYMAITVGVALPPALFAADQRKSQSMKARCSDSSHDGIV
jgi:hypothetical protein